MRSVGKHLDNLKDSLFLHVSLLPAGAHEQRVLGQPHQLIHPVLFVV
jgi:hypothetical protein